MTRAVRVELSAVVVALTGEGRETDLTVMMAPGPDLPGRAFDPDEHRTLELSLRDWVGRTTGLRLGFVEQLYTFGDRARDAQLGPDQPHKVSIGYLAVVPRDDERGTGGDWASVSQFFPWEDRRAGVPAILEEEILPRLAVAPKKAGFGDRVALAFALDGQKWRDDLVLERYELIYAAGLVPERHVDRGRPAPRDLPKLGQPLPLDHRRILATGLGRLRAKLKYRPVLFDLMPERFTLGDLQDAAEAVTGQPLHKQNFRRMIQASGLVEPTGGTVAGRAGRPAAEYRLTREAEWERRIATVRFGGARR